MNAIKLLFNCPERAARAAADLREHLQDAVEETAEWPDLDAVVARFDPRPSAPFPQWVG
jgi:hypothetical protein